MNSIEQTDPLAAVPETAPGAEALADENGTLHVRKPIVPRSQFFVFLNRVFKKTDYIKIHLDQYGTRYWELIDGHRNLRSIARKLASHFALEVKEGEASAVVFTKMLMNRQLIRLRIPAGKKKS